MRTLLSLLIRQPLGQGRDTADCLCTARLQAAAKVGTEKGQVYRRHACRADETIDAYEADSITVQWCMIEASATYAGHPDGNFHNYGMINGPDGGPASIHHCLWAHHNHRTPAIANGPSDIRNNVVYNTTTGFVHHNPTNDMGFNFVGNYYKTGPDRGLDENMADDTGDDDDDGYTNIEEYLHYCADARLGRMSQATVSDPRVGALPRPARTSLGSAAVVGLDGTVYHTSTPRSARAAGVYIVPATTGRAACLRALTR